jgi:radical SAM superfamily enzyme YgiQ (UPF0313 family)
MKFSIIICTYNRDIILNESLLSYIPFLYSEATFEILIIDNFGKSNTKLLVENLRNTSTLPLKYIYEENKGLSNARNRGINIAGGPHVNIFPQQSLGIFDAISVGKGEESIKKIANDIEFGKFKMGKIYNMEAGGEYPFPRRDFLPKEKVVTSLFKTENIPSTTVLFAHGCPFLCTFCANYNRGSLKRRSLEQVSEEIDYLKQEYDIRGLSLQDEICFPYRDNEAFEFIDLLRRKNVVWRGQTRAGVKDAIIAHAGRSGCLELSIGLESVDQEVLNLARKGIKVEDARDTLERCHKYGIKTRLYLLNGLPGEPSDIVERTKKFINEVKPDVVLLSTLQPYPGSDIYEHPERYGIEWIDRDYSKYNHLRCRFKDSKDKVEDAVPFKYAEGRGPSRQKIMDNLVELQGFLRDRELNK